MKLLKYQYMLEMKNVEFKKQKSHGSHQATDKHILEYNIKRLKKQHPVRLKEFYLLQQLDLLDQINSDQPDECHSKICDFGRTKHFDMNS